MNGLTKHKWTHRVLILVFSIIAVLITVYLLLSPANPDPVICGQIEHVHNDDCYHEGNVLSCGVAAHQHDETCFAVLSDTYSGSQAEQVVSLSNHAVMPLAAVSQNALQLKYPDTIDSITFSYKEYGEWIEITEENNSKLSADANYQLKIEYDNITAQKLLDADLQMIYTGLPEWFAPDEKGAVLYGSVVVAEIAAYGDTVVITFKEDWLRQQKPDGILHGFFVINGNIQWDKIPDGGESSSPIPGLSFDLDFEDGLASKYGNLSIEKKEPEFIEQDGKNYLKYEIHVTSSEDSAAIPDVSVKDTFTANSGYIKGYVGVGDLTEPAKYYPQESSTVPDSAKGEISMDGESMIWKIGVLQPHESRTLTYYAEIQENYFRSVLNSQFRNLAEVSSAGYLKGTDSSTYKPQGSVWISKELTKSDLDAAGTGTLEYTITVSAPATNTYTLEGLTLNDFFPTALKEFLTVSSITVSAGGTQQTIGDASFTLEDIRLAPGEEMTITYTVDAENLFASNVGDIELTNTASIIGGGRTLRSASNTKTFRQNQWLRKIYGDPLEEDTSITIPLNDAVYNSDKNRIENNGDIDFTVPEGSLQYQVVLNEDGRWDLSATSMRDTFGDNYMKYLGYLRIQIFQQHAVNADGEALSDNEVLDNLNGAEAAQTVWLDVDALNSFAFTPAELGLPSGDYTYLLTYYAHPVGVEDIGSFEASNSFGIYGTVGIGNGSGGQINIAGLTVTVRNVMQGGIHYEAEKQSWYYEKPEDMYRTDIVGSAAYTEADFKKDYTNGAIYWIIRLEGTIPEGDWEDQDQSTTFKGFYLKDTPVSQTTKFNKDALVGAYVAPKTLDLTQYQSFEEFLSDHTGAVPLNGNPLNDKYSPGTAVASPDYQWYAETYDLNRIFFPKGYTLKNNEAIFIVLRTAPANAVPTGSEGAKDYENELLVGSGSDTPILIDTAQYAYRVKGSLYKESKGAFTYDAETGVFTNCSTKTNLNGWDPDSLDKEPLKESGTYAPWLLNINWDGTMEGTAEVSDFLPEGMELVYVDIQWRGNPVKNNPPRCETIPELEDSDEWIKLVKDNPEHPDYGTAITYYNPTTREIRWNIGNLTRNPNAPAYAPVYKGYELNLRIVCKVTDFDALLGKTSKTFDNYAVTGDEIDSDSVTIIRNGSMNKTVLANDNNGEISTQLNELPFSIEINPFGEDLSDSDVLPALIDELSEGLILIEDSLTVEDAAGNPIRGYSYTIQKGESGGQTIIIQNLPDNQKLVIKYSAKINAEPHEKKDISNNAYWAGYASGSPQIDHKSFSYNLFGAIYKAEELSIKITKVDSGNHNRKLAGAKFELWTVDENGEKTGSEAIRSDTTQNNGELIFPWLEDGKPSLQFNTVYCIIETEAPAGYQLDDEPHYFVIADNSGTFNRADYPGISELEVWYNSPEYSYTMANEKAPISVNKVFTDGNGNSYTPASGSYRFGLYDIHGSGPLEVLTIEYAADPADGAPVIRYYLDGIEKTRPFFSNYESESVYYVYELDDAGNPITDGDLDTLNGITYRVNYYDGNGASGNQVTVNSRATIVNSEDLTVDLTIHKTVTGSNGDQSKYFGFTLTLTPPNGMLLAQSYSYTLTDPDTEQISGTATLNLNSTGGYTVQINGNNLTLKHGQSITLHGLPSGTGYTVIEDDYSADGYETTVDGKSGLTAKGQLTDNTDVHFLNSHSEVITTPASTESTDMTSEATDATTAATDATTAATDATTAATDATTAATDVTSAATDATTAATDATTAAADATTITSDADTGTTPDATSLTTSATTAPASTASTSATTAATGSAATTPASDAATSTTNTTATKASATATSVKHTTTATIPTATASDEHTTTTPTATLTTTTTTTPAAASTSVSTTTSTTSSSTATATTPTTKITSTTTATTIFTPTTTTTTITTTITTSAATTIPTTASSTTTTMTASTTLITTATSTTTSSIPTTTTASTTSITATLITTTASATTTSVTTTSAATTVIPTTTTTMIPTTTSTALTTSTTTIPTTTTISTTTTAHSTAAISTTTTVAIPSTEDGSTTTTTVDVSGAENTSATTTTDVLIDGGYETESSTTTTATDSHTDDSQTSTTSSASSTATATTAVSGSDSPKTGRNDISIEISVLLVSAFLAATAFRLRKEGDQ